MKFLGFNISRIPKEERTVSKANAALIFFLVLSIITCAILVIHSNNLSEDLEIANQTIEDKNKELESLRESKERMREEYAFFHKYAVIVTKTGNKYHHYDCGHIKDKSLYIYNIQKAEANGYSACSDCFTQNSEDIDTLIEKAFDN